ncbi:phosphoribosyltransferase [Acinetobacter pittii]|uniref:phosphoribosyltransferase n=1 Tax=Acinetobacter TaxID=469 RepID=UPI0021EFFBEB|nr:hypothetical protein MWMV18_MWMV18_02051 [Acinetobacter calcoaceticus]
MGITVDQNKVVRFDPTSEQLVSTSIHANPISNRMNDLLIYGVFKRLYNRDGDRRDSDGNPLIYALKNKNGFSITMKECARFNPNLSKILDKILLKKSYDIVISMPSSQPVSERFAIKISRKIGGNCPILTNVFTKKTIEEVYNDLLSLQVVAKDRKDLIALRRVIESRVIKEPKTIFSMKEIAKKDRKFIKPLKYNPDYLAEIRELKGKSIVIVDDLLASGSTLISAYELLLEREVTNKIEAICLLGKK